MVGLGTLSLYVKSRGKCERAEVSQTDASFGDFLQVGMSMSAVCLALASLEYQPRWLRIIEYVFYGMNIVTFALNTISTVLSLRSALDSMLTGRFGFLSAHPAGVYFPKSSQLVHCLKACLLLKSRAGS